MKRVFRFVALNTLAAVLMLPGQAQSHLLRFSPTSNTLQGEGETKYSLYKRFLENHKTDQPAAFEAAKAYLQKYPEESEQTRYLQRWVNSYSAITRRFHVRELITEKRFNEAFALGKEILTSEPEDMAVLYHLIDGGLYALDCGNETYIPDARKYAHEALKLVESGDGTDETRARTIGWLNRSLGIFYLRTAPSQAAKYLYRALEFEAFKKDPFIYRFIADAIIGAHYVPLKKELGSRFTTPEQRSSEQAEPIRVKLFLAVDHIIDALVRAIALASDAHSLQAKAAWMNTLRDFYRYRNSGYDTGLSEFMAAILIKPMPLYFSQP